MTKDQKMVPLILWGAMLMSHFIFVFIQWSGMIKPGAQDLSIVPYFYAAAAVIALGNLMFFKQSHNIETLSIRYNEMETGTRDEKLAILFNLLNTKSILSWGLNETITILGIVASIMSGLPFILFLGFAGLGIFLHLSMFPRHEKLLEQL